MAPLAHQSGVGEVVSIFPRTGLPGSLAHPFTEWAFPVKLIGDEGKRCAAYRLLFARRFPKRALSSSRRALRERVTNRLAPIATLALPSHKGSFVQHFWKVSAQPFFPVRWSFLNRQLRSRPAILDRKSTRLNSSHRC